jgi:hypothetical protein
MELRNTFWSEQAASCEAYATTGDPVYEIAKKFENRAVERPAMDCGGG